MMIDIKKATCMINGSMFENDGGINMANDVGESMMKKDEILKIIDRKANNIDLAEIAN